MYHGQIRLLNRNSHNVTVFYRETTHGRCCILERCHGRFWFFIFLTRFFQGGVKLAILLGGNSKFYGAALIRYRASDFVRVEHFGGTSPAWPIEYHELEADYQAAEELYAVRGRATDDPTEPYHSGNYPFAPVPDEPDMAALRERLTSARVRPSHIPTGVELDAWLEAGQTTWDAYPNTCGAKMDAESCGLASALTHDNVNLQTGCAVARLEKRR